MTWKRVATAAVLIPFVVGLVVRGSTAIVALAVATVTLLALFEYFALGEAIGHRAYRFWTATCALLLIYAQWLATNWPADDLTVWGLRYLQAFRFFGGGPYIMETFFFFFLGVVAVSPLQKRPLV